MRFWIPVVAAVVLASAAFPQESKELKIGTDYVMDVQPVLIRAGCMAGSCHGAALGQKEFKLSLLGSNPRRDWEAITRELRGRRIDRSDPEESLILRKSSGRTRHKGGTALPRDSEGYRIVLAWLGAGAPWRTTTRSLERIEVTTGDSIRVRAFYTDRTQRDVTRWALYSSNDESIAHVDKEGRVKVLRPGETAILVRYGGHVGIARVGRPFGKVKFDFAKKNFVDEHVAARFKAVGRVPGKPCSDETFLRRAMLDIIGILPTPEEVREFRKKPDREALIDRLLDRPEFNRYWAYRISQLFPVSTSLHNWLEAKLESGTSWKEISSEILVSQGRTPGTAFFQPNKPKELAENLAQTFLGMRISCAQCHDHPFAKFSQSDYYGVAAFFARTRVKNGQVSLMDRGDIRDPYTNQVIEPTFPGGVKASFETGEDRREKLSTWISGHDQFTRAMANRVWALLLGRGLVEPIDDMRLSNPATNEPLLAALATDFREAGFKLRPLVRRIALSNTYQCLKKPRLLSAEVLVDAIADATGIPDSVRATETPALKSKTLDLSGRREEFDGSLAQSLHLITSEAINSKLLLMKNMSLEEMYLRTLSRLPNAQEKKRNLRSREEKEDFMWALLNSKEFMHGH